MRIAGIAHNGITVSIIDHLGRITRLTTMSDGELAVRFLEPGIHILQVVEDGRSQQIRFARE